MPTLESPGRSESIPQRMSLDEYHQLVAVGVLGEDEPLELLEGVVAEMAPQGRAHAQVISRLGEELVAKRPEGCRVRVQLPLSLGEDSEPEPDLALVTRQEEQAAPDHPRTTQNPRHLGIVGSWASPACGSLKLSSGCAGPPCWT
jgi:Uma2 family endonuclease